ncbi:hypothetical protein [Candidatus Protochlamydia amoebophila]|uniref:Uncharacterized protein n=1 Tax=Protochlamydia amoebophila (strain UWE25) TaxID=264201 RepID=A0A2P9HAW5_PARUW|nr:hypothetical protein [Candidatus Protochlamydia amoebophila]SPJ31867.1 unnamed protein product [Candidatus Protochlamydia amoebophila UWE25]
MVKQQWIFLLFYTFPCVASMQTAKQAGQSWGKDQASLACDSGKKIRSDDFLTTDEKKQAFDAKAAEKKMKQRDIPSSETIDFLTSQEVQNNQNHRSFHEEENFFQISEKIFANQTPELPAEKDKEEEQKIYTCKQAGDPFIINTERTLKVSIHPFPAQEAKICLGHKKIAIVKKIGDFPTSIKKLEQSYRNDPAIDPSSVQIICFKVKAQHYFVQVSYHHFENVEGCDHCQMIQKKGE